MYCPAHKQHHSAEAAKKQKKEKGSCVYWDYVDKDVADELGQVAATAYINLNRPGYHYKKNEPLQSLQQRIHEDMTRCTKDGRLPVAYHEHKLSNLVAMPGRLTQGLSPDACFPDQRSEAAYQGVADSMTRFHASRGNFAAPWQYKQIMRGGLEGPCLDFDISKSFARAMRHRYPHLTIFSLWIDSPEEFAEQSGITVDLAKEFCNSCVGCGQAFVNEFLGKASLDALPERLEEYWSATKEVMRLDKENHPDLFKLICSQGHSDRDASCKLTFVLNSFFERELVDNVLSSVTGEDTTDKSINSVECDGIVLMPSQQLQGDSLTRWKAKTITWMKQFPEFKNKPYLSLQSLIEDIKKEWAAPEVAWHTIDSSWREKCALRCELFARLSRCETPVLIAAKVIPHLLQADGRLVKDNVVAISSGRESVSYFIYKSCEYGGYWQQDTVSKPLLEEIVVNCMSTIMGIFPSNAPAAWVAGAFTNNICSRLSYYLLDNAVSSKMDGDQTFCYLQFSCGRVMNLSSLDIEPGRPELYISKHVGYAFPDKEFQLIGQRLEEEEITLSTLFNDIKADDMTDRTYTADTIRTLKKLTNMPEFELFGVVSNSFVPRGEGVQEALGWQVAIFRGLKTQWVALSVRGEFFFVDIGVDGNNGKGFFWNLTKRSFGQYATECKDTMLQKDPPSPGAPFPDLLALRGCRWLGTPEVETKLEVKSKWLKLLADSSTIWKARNLFENGEIEFFVPAKLNFSANVRPSFSTLDGGVRRRGVGINWPIHFNDAPSGNFERQSVSGIKKAEFFSPMKIAGYLYLILANARAWNNEDMMVCRPKLIKDATNGILSDELAELLEEFVELSMHTVEGAKQASSELQVTKAVTAHLKAQVTDLTADIIKSAIMSMMVFPTLGGARSKCRQATPPRSWLALNA